jgi:hypothetical protein
VAELPVKIGLLIICPPAAESGSENLGKRRNFGKISFFFRYFRLCLEDAHSIAIFTLQCKKNAKKNKLKRKNNEAETEINGDENLSSDSSGKSN